MTARSLIVQILLAVEYIHSKGFVHGGQSPLLIALQPYAYTTIQSDLHIGNMLLYFSADFSKLSIEELYEKYGSPASEPVRSTS
jgi:serine/threonine protein kinase